MYLGTSKMKILRASNIIIILSVLSSILILLYIIQLNQKSNNLETELKNFDKTSATDIREISNPIFKSKGLESNSYTIEADRGIQDDGYIELYNVKAEFEGENNKIFYVSADKGIYKQQYETIELIKNVLILDELKNKTSTNKAVIELNIKKITLLEEVVSVTSKAYISSNSSILDELNNTITYLGNVKAQIENE
jgi:hypothetical protein